MSTFYFDFSSANSASPTSRDFASNGLIIGLGCYSMLHEGAFRLCYVLFDKEVGHNGTKLSQLFNKPFTYWQCAAKRFESHKKNSVACHDSMLRLNNFDKVMFGRSKGIDKQTDQY